MHTRADSAAGFPGLLLLLATLLWIVQSVVAFPGQLVFDSQQALEQALTQNYGDWHPPIMALVWHWLIHIFKNRGALLVVHLGLQWLGIGLVADACYRAGMTRRAWCILAAGLFPFFLEFDKIIVKDVGMASGFIAGTGLLVWYFLQQRSPPWWIWLFAALCLMYATLIRTNGAFALGPLLFVLLTRCRRISFPGVLICSIVVTGITIPLSGWINHRIMGARLQDPMQSLQIFDLMGIAVRAGDGHLWGDQSPPLETIRGCYTSYWWDTFSPWGACAHLRPQIGASPDIDTVDQSQVTRRGRLWREAILHHPLAYATHRLCHFNSSMYFFVPSLHFRYAHALWGRPAPDADEIRRDYLKRPFFFWPAFWFALGLGALFQKSGAEQPAAVGISHGLMLSGLFYSAGYLLVGVSSEIRYHYWPIMTILAGILLAPDALLRSFREQPSSGRLIAGAVAVVIIFGYAARLSDISLY
jgi:hypothetical protein